MRPAAAKQKKKAAKSGIPKWVWFVGGAGLLIPITCCGLFGLAFLATKGDGGGPVVPIASTLKTTKLPSAFPSLGEPEKTYPSGVKRYFVSLNQPGGSPGTRMQWRVYLPLGQHQDRSLACVLVAPAGTPMIHGANLDDGDYDDETLPYAEAGFVVIQYSIDGAPSAVGQSSDEEASPNGMMEAYPVFKASGAGVVNGRNSLEFALSELPMVDPRRIHCAGHSSAGTLSLLLAQHEPRINRCVAYAAAYDLESRMDEMASNFMGQRMFPGIDKFVVETSPLNHVDKFDGPVFIFHARDDSNVPFSDAEKFVQRIKSAGKDVTFEISNTGEHYYSMIDPGIPLAIRWLKQDE